MIAFVSGVMVGGLVGLVIATLMISSGNASEDERVHESYRAGLIAGRDRP